MSKQQMVSGTRGIGQLLNERRYFAVPPHQRDYAWPVGAVEQFLDDVIEAMIESDSDYFIGLIVLVDTSDPTKKRYEILDGQQRLATTTMIYSAIRQWMRDHGEDNEAAKIQNEFIGISEIGEEKDEPRIVMNINNQEIFQDIVVNPCPDTVLQKRQAEAGRHTSTRKLVEAAIRCRQLVAELAEKHGQDPKQQAEALFALAKYLRDRVLVNCLDVTAPENAYTIFESLNDRGIDLSVLDLLKNHLLRQTKDGNQQQVQNNWTKMLTRLGDRRADDFLKAFWTSRYGRIQRGRLFHELKKKYKTKAQVLVLSSELPNVADVYANIEVADSDLWRNHTPATQEAIRALSILGGRQTHPILLAALAKFAPMDIEKLVRHLVNLIVRYQLVGRGRTGRLEIKASSVATAIFNRKLKTSKAIWDDLKNLLPSDSEFEEDFRRYEEPKAPRARWVLRELEIEAWRQANPGKAVQQAPLTDPEKVNLEHILPKNPGVAWGAVMQTEAELVSDCVDMLGNLCLLDKPSNKKQAAKGFSDKVALYKQSEFLLTCDLATNYTQWNRDTIENRQAQLAKLALRAWPL